MIELRFQLSNPHGTSQRATAIATVSFGRVRDKTYFTKADPPPHVGERRTLRLNNHVITEPLVVCALLRARSGGTRVRSVISGGNNHRLR
ncbi:MAG: hypothetical protein M3P18_08665 [Actinomycetota bacterium]|nr:hypothetical protein [Actinomycetota bacterium]